MKTFLLQSCICFIFLCALICMGILFVFIAQIPQWHMGAIEFLQSQQHICLQIGGGLITIALFFFVVLYFMSRKSFYTVELDASSSYSVNNALVKKEVDHIFKEVIPSISIPFDMQVFQDNIQLDIDFSEISFTEHETLLTQLEERIQEHFTRYFGTPKRVKMNILCKKA